MTATFQCHFCQTTFARHEHLSRHVRSHTREKPYRCLECGKSFSRQDVLNRHTASHAPGSARATSSRACIECATSRTRCSRETPCKRCVERGLDCVYPSTRKRKASSVEPSNAAETVSPARSVWAQAIDPPINTEDFFAAENNPGNFVPGPDQVVGMSTINWLSPHYQDTLGWDAGLDVLPYSNEAFAFPPSNTSPIASFTWQPGTRLDVPIEEPSLPFVTGTKQTGEPEAAPQPPASNRSATDSRASRSTEGLLYVEGAVSRAPFRGGLLYRESTVGHDGITESPSPHATPNSHDTTSSGGNLVSNLAYENLCRGIQHEVETHSSSLDPTSTPLLGHVRRFARLYFEKFHPTYPFLRQSPYIFDQPNSWILLLAISTVGAKYAGDSQFRPLLDLVDTVLTRRLLTTRSRESEELWTPGSKGAHKQPGVDLFTIQAEILRLLCLLHGGERQQMEHAFMDRYRLIEECKRMKLLSRTSPNFHPTLSDNHDSIITTWLEVQSEIRTGMMIWLLDSILEYEFNCSHLLDLHDAKAPLPSQETLWNHPTAERIIEKGSATATMVEALELLYMEKRLPSDLSEFATILLIYAVCRQTKEIAYQHQTSLSSWIPNAKHQTRPASQPTSESWPPSHPLLLRWRNSACDSLDLLHWNANGTAAKAGGWEHPTILHLHLSRLLLLTPAQHIQHVAAASSGIACGQEAPDTIYLEAWSHMRRWAALDQFKARLAMVHAGALFWHVRRYSNNSFIEPFATYLATLALWSYSISAQPNVQQAGRETQSQESAGDQISPHPLDITPVPSSELDEEPEQSFIQLDRPCDDEMVQMYVRLGRKMSGNVLRVGDICSPDAPPKILQEGLRLLSRDKDQASQRPDSVPSIPSPEDLNTWGIRESFAETLRRLLRMKASQTINGGP